jgi:hypothetical protein
VVLSMRIVEFSSLLLFCVFNEFVIIDSSC